MICTKCGLQMQPGTMACPRCGAPTHYAQAAYPYAAQPQQAQYAPPATPYNTPPTNYNQYGPPAPGYDPYTNAYAPQPPHHKKGNNVLITIVGILIALLMVVAVFIYLARYNSPSNTVVAATPTVNSTQNPYGSHTGTLVLSDSMQDNSKGYKWDESTMNGTTNGDVAHCTFSGNAYHIQRTNGGLTSCNPEASQLSFQNVTMEATLTIIKGDDAGFVVRIDQAKGTGYLLLIDRAGNYVIDTINFNDTKNPYKLLKSGKNQAIKQGLGVANVVAAVANGSDISLYVNGTYVDSATDTNYTQGQIGFCGYADKVPFDISVSNVRAWKQ